jgi:hypothetical protein
MALFAHLRRVIDKERFIEGHHQSHFGLSIPGGPASLQASGSHRCAVDNCQKSFSTSTELWQHYHEMGVPGFEQSPPCEKPSLPAAKEGLQLREESGPPEANGTDATASGHDDFSICSVCMDRPSEVVMVPCGHIYACEACGKKLSECALCREPVARVLRIYYSTKRSN